MGFLSPKFRSLLRKRGLPPIPSLPDSSTAAPLPSAGQERHAATSFGRSAHRRRRRRCLVQRLEHTALSLRSSRRKRLTLAASRRRQPHFRILQSNAAHFPTQELIGYQKMNTDREWMYRRYRDGSLTAEFLNGLESFMAFACTQHLYMNGEDIKCPCSKCKNKPFRSPHIVRLHLVKNGFVPKYYHWWVHGEQESPEVLGMSLRAEIRTNPFETMVLDVGGPSLKSKERIEESPTNGPGTGPIIHHGGSQKAPLHALDLEAAQRRLAEEISCYSINNASLPGTTEERIVITEREKDIHKEVAKVDRKSRVIGLGCLSQLYVQHESRGDICSSSSMMTQPDAHIRELEARLMAMEEEQTRREEEQTQMAEGKARKDAAIDAKMQEMRDQMALFSSYVKTMYPGFVGFNSSPPP